MSLCLVLPWDQVDEDTYLQPLEWSGRTLGRFMRFFGPISSIFDIVTFVFLFFVFCPSMCGGSFASLAAGGGQERFIALFQTGWFLESMWTQILILHLLRTRKIPLFQSKPSRSVMLVTTLGILIFTVMTFTPVGHSHRADFFAARIFWFPDRCSFTVFASGDICKVLVCKEVS